MRVGVDTGGTFTDLVSDTGDVAKVASTPRDPADAIRTVIGSLEVRPRLLAHGTTVATNALLQRSGGVVALYTTAGFADVVEIARQVRPSLYDLDANRPPPLVAREHRIEVAERLDAEGREITAVGPVGDLPPGAEVAAVCLLHADLDPAHEKAVAHELMSRGIDVTCSHEVSPEFREYERTVTTVANAMLRPVCRSYLASIGSLADEVLVMTSAGGLVPAEVAAELPAALLLSGPAGGVRAAAAVAGACGYGDAVSFDMGGTSTDVCLIRNGVPEPAPSRVVAGYPIRLPALDVHTIGAGGGSIARIDPGGALVVGPESSGAEPGPAAYGRGGDRPTVTDADLVLGRIPLDGLESLGRLDAAAARRALDRAGAPAEGVVAVVDAAMQRAVRAVTVERGVDPRDVALVAFGGAGPLHACSIADGLDMNAVLVPPRAGVLSAVGLVCSPHQRELVRSWPHRDRREGLARALEDLAAEVAAEVGESAEVETSVDCRYVGQSHELTVETPDAFHAEHGRRNGYERPDESVEVVALRARARLPAPLAPEELPDVARGVVTGPAVVAEADATMYVPDGWRAVPEALGTWVLRRTS